MRKPIYIISFIILFSSCCRNSPPEQIKIKPLHPYSSTPASNTKETSSQNYIAKYYFIEGACTATNEISKQVDSFAITTIKNDKDFINFGAYYLFFYRKTKNINENFRESVDGMISYNLLDSYKEDLLFEYSWSDTDFLACKYYKGGKVVKTIYDKGDGVLKRNPASPIPDTNKVHVEDLAE